MQPNQDEWIRCGAALSLGQMNPTNPEAIEALADLVQSPNKDIRRKAAERLGQIEPGNQKAIKTLIELVQTPQDGFTSDDAVESLKKIIPDSLFSKVVSDLKECWSNGYCYEVLWHCAQNLPYPDFHQAWQ